MTDTTQEELLRTKREKIRAKFLARVEKTDGCWRWRGGMFQNGYEGFTSRSRRSKRIVCPTNFSLAPFLMVFGFATNAITGDVSTRIISSWERTPTTWRTRLRRAGRSA